MNTHLSPANFKPAALIALLHRNRVALIGAVLVGLFGYTAYVVNGALNPTPAAPTAAPAEIRFDKGALETVKSLQTVPGTVDAAPSGKNDPFSQ